MEFDLPLTRAELAEHTNILSESVVRVLKDFSDEGMIEMIGKSFKITNYEILGKISEVG